MAEFHPPEGLRQIIERAIMVPLEFVQDQDPATGEPYETVAEWSSHAVLAALFEACTVWENPHMWLGDGTRGGRSLVLRFPLPDEPMPEPGPMPPELAAALARARAKLAAEKGAQWAIRDADGNTGDYADDERAIRQSWAQGITWWDPDGTYELCRRDGTSGPWEVVERHPVVSDGADA